MAPTEWQTPHQRGVGVHQTQAQSHTQVKTCTLEAKQDRGGDVATMRMLLSFFLLSLSLLPVTGFSGIGLLGQQHSGFLSGPFRGSYAGWIFTELGTVSLRIQGETQTAGKKYESPGTTFN